MPNKTRTAHWPALFISLALVTGVMLALVTLMSAEPGRISAATDQDRQQTRPNSQCISPIAGFIPSATTVRVNQVITFNNTSTGSAPLTYLWHFHDGLTSTLEDPTHAYTVMGVYTVTLTASNACGMSVHSPVTITVPLDKVIQAEPVPEQAPICFVYPASRGCTSGGAASYAFVNHPWDWIEGVATPGETLSATLKRVGNPTTLSDLVWQDGSGNGLGQPTFYLDDISLIGTLQVYTDALAGGWQDWSWNTTRSFDNVQPVHSGSASIAVTYTAAWGGLYLHTDTALPASDYTAIRFWVHGGSTGGQSVNFHLNNGGGSYPVTVQANTWLSVTVPLAALGNPTTFTTTTINSNGRFSFDFRDSNGHMNVLPGDEVILVGGGLSTTIQVVDIAGSINIADNTVTGQATQGVFPAQGVADVGFPTDLSYITKEITFDPTGHFSASFGGQVDIGTDRLAKVDYQDPNGNRVVQVFFPEGLDIRALITEGRIEGVTTPGATVQVIVSNTLGFKGSATTTADQTGFYSTTLYNGNRKVRLQLGDHVSVSKPGRVREMDLTMYHVSYIRPWENRVAGTVYGVSLPAQGTQIRIDLWSAAQNQWYTKYEGIKSDGSYNADFGGIVQMTAKDRIRVWATSPDGNQQAALGWALDIGASTTDDAVWGYTTANATAVISLYGRLENQTPVDLIGTATVMADAAGYFSTTVMAGGSVADIVPDNAVIVQAGEHSEALLVRPVDAQIDVSSDMLSLTGPPNTRVHVEGRRAGVQREDAPYQSPYVWREVTLDSDGKASVSLSPFDVHSGDWFDFTLYGPKEGVAVHDLVIVPSTIYLPIVLR